MKIFNFKHSTIACRLSVSTVVAETQQKIQINPSSNAPTTVVDDGNGFSTVERRLERKLFLPKLAKKNFVEFVLERNTCKQLVDSHNAKRNLHADFGLIGSKCWDGILFSRLRSQAVFIALIHLFLNFEDENLFEKFVGKRYSIDSIVNFFSSTLINMKSTDLLTLFCSLALIKERRNVFYEDLTRNIIDEFHRRTFVSNEFHLFTIFFETLHRFGDDVFERPIESYADVMNYKLNEFRTWPRLSVDNYGIVCYAMTLSERTVDEILIQKIIKLFDKSSTISTTLFKSTTNVGFICYFLNWYRCKNYAVPFPSSLDDKLKMFLNDSEEIKSDFTSECVKRLLEYNKNSQ